MYAPEVGETIDGRGEEGGGSGVVEGGCVVGVVAEDVCRVLMRC